MTKRLARTWSSCSFTAEAQLDPTEDPDAEFTDLKFWAARGDCPSLHAYPDAKRFIAELLEKLEGN